MKGKTFGQWTIEELIDDSGGNGVVWRVSNSAGHVGALKMLKSFADPNKASKRRKRFINEISKLEMIKKMGIAGVMPILDCDAEHEPPWFVMPLASRLSPTGDQMEWSLTTMIRVSECIAQLHKEGMVHRDIKPSNLLVLDGSVVISDFGLARVIGDEINTRTGEGVGSFGYIAPECVGHSDEPQFKCDVYALAKTAWTLFAGANSPPFGELREPQDSLADRELTTSSIDLKQLDELLISSTERDPADRPTAQQFLDSLVALRAKDQRANVRKSSSPADRARALFSDQSARNRRDVQSKALFDSLAQETDNKFFPAWKPIVESLGWSTSTVVGGSGGIRTEQLGREGWECSRRYFYTGEIDGATYDIALSFCRFQTRAEARLVLSATINIKVGQEEHILASFDRETYTTGPQVEQMRKDLFTFAQDEETQYRAVEKLRELSR